MSALDYGTEAVLYCGKTVKGRGKALRFERFGQAAEAIRYAVEDLPPRALDSCSLEVDDERYFGKAIRVLYESADFPLPRRAVKAG